MMLARLVSIVVLAVGLSRPTAHPALAGTLEPAASSVRGIVRAEARATLSSELVARIDALPFKAGQAFRAGDELVAFDCRRYLADLEAAEAEVKAQLIEVETNRQLLRHRATGSNDLARAEAKHAQADATARSLKVRTTYCSVIAPYDGRIVERHVDVHEVPQANAALLSIVKEGALEIDVIVPSQWSTWLEQGHTFRFRIDETSSEHDARILRLGAVVDPVSRSMKMTALLTDPTSAIRPGMSGTAIFQPGRSLTNTEPRR